MVNHAVYSIVRCREDIRWSDVLACWSVSLFISIDSLAAVTQRRRMVRTTAWVMLPTLFVMARLLSVTQAMQSLRRPIFGSSGIRLIRYP